MTLSRIGFVFLALSALTITFVSAQKSQAFYWVGWPGSGDPSTTTTTTTGTPTTVTTTGDPGGTATTTGNPSTGPSDPGGSGVPEPASVIVGLVGLGSLGLARRLRRA
jgi:hypothetical protein